MENKKKVTYLVVDTSAFIKNAPLQEIAENIYTCEEVVNEINNKRQLKRLAVLPYDLKIKNVDPEYIKIITDFSKKTGDYPSLSATDIKVMALTYQLEKEVNGTDHLRTEPVMQKSIKFDNKKPSGTPEVNTNISGFFLPKQEKEVVEKIENMLITDTDTNSVDTNNVSEPEPEQENLSEPEPSDDETEDEIDEISDPISVDVDMNDILKPVQDNVSEPSDNETEDDSTEPEPSEDEETKTEEDDSGWITPSNLRQVQKTMGSELAEDKHVAVGCMTMDFAMQNVLKQMNLNVCALDGRIIKHLRTFILRCYACYKTTSLMERIFCPNCGNNTLKKVAVSVGDNGKLEIHINTKKPLSSRGKRFSMPKFKGGKHSNNPIIVEDQPLPQNRVSKLAKQKIDPFSDSYVTGFSPFITRDIGSRSAQLCIRPGQNIKHLMSKRNEKKRK